MRYTLIGVLGLAMGLGSAASACVFDGIVGNPFELPHPRSLEVAMAVYDAAQQGRIDPDAGGPALEGQAGLQRALWRLQRLGRGLGSSDAGDPAVSLVLVDSALWVRLTPAPLGMAIQSHVSGPAPGDVVAVSSELVVVQLLGGQLSGEDALRRGLLLLEGDASAVQRVAARFAGIGALR
ncbi:MAG: hypothetical protein MUF16_05635 [Burkholderiaceae bacterium]|nr:hypothetical protein [Burkholderiaceae bacterium]